MLCSLDFLIWEEEAVRNGGIVNQEDFVVIKTIRR